MLVHDELEVPLLGIPVAGGGTVVPQLDDIFFKVLRHIADMQAFLGKLKLSTETIEESIRAKLTTPLAHLWNLRESLDDIDKDKIDKCPASLDEIFGILERKNKGSFNSL
ncbi:MAG: hypothetical protein JW847_05450 [Candidatus Omnitrophica bacterium]|nr:hypothetical protein [Candidatus Omnitrophota bacterium]